MYTMTNRSTGEIFEHADLRALVRVALSLARYARRTGDWFSIAIYRMDTYAEVCRVSHGSMFLPGVGVRIR